jgi:hypothetical protein
MLWWCILCNIALVRNIWTCLQRYRRERNLTFLCYFSTLSVSIWCGWWGEFKGLLQRAGRGCCPTAWSQGLRCYPPAWSQGLRYCPPAWSQALRYCLPTWSQALRYCPPAWSQGLRYCPTAWSQGLRKRPGCYLNRNRLGIKYLAHYTCRASLVTSLL